MTIWDVKAPPTVKAGDETKALALARKGVTVSPQPPKPPPAPSPFLEPRADAKVIWSDPCTDPDPMGLYGAFIGARKDGGTDQNTFKVDEIAPGRLSRVLGAGAPYGPSGGLPYRTLTVQPGDQAWGNRAALGYDNANSPVCLFHEGEERQLDLWLTVSALNTTSNWREVLEVKQAEPYPPNIPSRGVMFEIQQNQGNWVVMTEWGNGVYWTTPAKAGTWVPVSIQGLWSRDPSKGRLQVKIGDVTSPLFTGIATLLRGYPDTNTTVPSYLELGPYQSSVLPGFTLGVAMPTVWGT